MSRTAAFSRRDPVLTGPSPGSALAPRPSGAIWLPTVDEAFRRMLAAIEGAIVSVRLETYIFREGEVGDRFRDALVAAARRGVRVRVLLDGFGSADLPRNYWDRLRAAGGEMYTFNPRSLLALAVRNHRKLLLVDDALGFIGGFNLADEYAGDGVGTGWRDLGLALNGTLIAGLAASFDAMWAHRDFHYIGGLRALRARLQHRFGQTASAQLALAGPGLGRNAVQKMLVRGVREADEVRIIAAYFTPSRRLRRALRQVVRRGGRVRVILAAKTDVPMAQAAARTFYTRLLRAGIELAEYEPQILHAKLVIAGQSVFVGSANLDARSLAVNYELMARIYDPALAAEGRAIFDADWKLSRQIRWEEWSRRQTWTSRLYGALARFCLTKIDPWFARRQLRNLA